MGLGYDCTDTGCHFSRDRFIGVVGREALHVFDLAQMDFVYADEASGYKVNLETTTDWKVSTTFDTYMNLLQIYFLKTEQFI